MLSPMKLLLAALAASLSFLFLPDAPRDVEPVTIILVRHAERFPTTAEDRDPGLTEVGEERARALAALLAKAGVTHLYATEFERTRATLEPLARLLSLEVEVVPASDGEGQVAKLEALPPGAVAVVSGHSNTVPALVRALGGELRDLEDHPTYGEIIAGEEHDRLFIVTPSPAEGVAVDVLELRYPGAP